MNDYTTVTESPGQNASGEQLQRLFTRYHFAYQQAEGKDILEAACGTGIGLGYLAKRARKVVGGDIDEGNLVLAHKQYADRPHIELRQFDAHTLPFVNQAFDMVMLYEAVYYLKKPEEFIKEAWRVLRRNGIIIICSVNKDWADFNPSPYSLRYFSAPELAELLEQNGFTQVALYGDCAAQANTIKEKIISFIKRTAVRLNLIPKTMKDRELLKKIFFGKLSPLPPEVYEGMAAYQAPETIDRKLPNRQYKVLFALGHKL